MKLKLPRRRLLLIACLVVAIAAICWWQFSIQSRFTREQFDRIRFGMTPAEVSGVMGSAPSGGTSSRHYYYEYMFGYGDDPDIATDCWDIVADEANGWPDLLNSQVRDEVHAALLKVEDRANTWGDESVQIWVMYHDDKVIRKEMQIRVPPWKVKALKWLDWLRGLVGW
jgi:hypothetical protein